MHSPDKIQLFFDLRSRGNCLSYISRTIGIPTSTLSDWNRRYALDIDASRACKWEAAEQAVKFNTEADLVRVIQRIDAFERELDRRSPERMSVGELVRVISLWRREYFRRRNALLRSIERPTPIPESESEISDSVPPDLQRRGFSDEATSSKRGLTPAHPHAAVETNNITNPTDRSQAIPSPEGEGQGEGLQTSNSKPEKTGIPDAPPSHSPTFSAAHPHAAAETNNTSNPTDRSHAIPSPGGEGQGEGDSPALNSQPSTLNPSPPPLFSIEDHLPTPMDEWLPDDDDQLRVYRARQPVDADNPIPKKTNIASAA
jgi:hypothetical protein